MLNFDYMACRKVKNKENQKRAIENMWAGIEKPQLDTFDPLDKVS